MKIRYIVRPTKTLGWAWEIMFQRRFFWVWWISRHVVGRTKDKQQADDLCGELNKYGTLNSYRPPNDMHDIPCHCSVCEKELEDALNDPEFMKKYEEACKKVESKWDFDNDDDMGVPPERNGEPDPISATTKRELGLDWKLVCEVRPAHYKVEFKTADGKEYKGNYSKTSGLFYAYDIGDPIENVTHWRPQ